MSSIIKVNTFQDANGNALFSSDGSGNLTGTNKLGITVADLWRQNADTAISAGVETFLTSNWEQADAYGAGTVGSAMSVSSGVFTFPETGVYLINFFATIYSPSQGATYATGRIHTTTDNSSYNRAADGNSSIYHPNGFSISTSSFMFNVSNTTTHKCKFACICEFASDVGGNTAYNRTSAQFIRLGA